MLSKEVLDTVVSAYKRYALVQAAISDPKNKIDEEEINMSLTEARKAYEPGITPLPMTDREWRACAGVSLNDAGEKVGVSVDETLAERGKRYGKFVHHAHLSTELRNLVDGHHRVFVNSKGFQPVQMEAITLICHKLARIANGDPDYDDTWRDIAGYATLVVNHLNGVEV